MAIRLCDGYDGSHHSGGHASLRRPPSESSEGTLSSHRTLTDDRPCFNREDFFFLIFFFFLLFRFIVDSCV